MLRRSLHILKNGQYLYSSSRLMLHTSVFPVLYSRTNKDLPNPVYPTPVSKLYGPDTDILLEQLKKCNSIDRLLEMINMHLDVMNSRHIVICLDHIYSAAKKDKAVANSLMESHIFKSLCARLMKVVRLFEPQEVITAYKALCILEVRNNTYVMQSLLKMLSAHLNNMSLGQLTFLSFLLHKQRHNALVDGLRLAIPLVLQVQIDQQLDSDNLTETVNCLQLAVRSALKPVTIQKIVNAVKQKADLLRIEDAVTVVFSLLNTDIPIDGYNELLGISFDILSKNTEEINQKLTIILKTCRTQRFYHYKFFISAAETIVKLKWDLESTYHVLSHFYSLDCCPSNLLDYFTEVLCAESTQYQSNSLYSPLSCIEFLTATSYRPARIDEAARVLYSHESKLETLRTRNPHLLMKFQSCLAMLGHFPHEILSRILDEENLFNVWSLSKKIGRGQEFERYILSLYWSLMLYDETENFTIPQTILNKIIHSVYEKNLNAEYPLTKFIENGLGGPQFLQSGVFTEDGHVIDHIVAMRNGIYPVSLQNIKSSNSKERSVQHLMFVKDIILPEDAKIIAIIVAKKQDYLRDPEILRGWVDLKIRCLAKKNYATVVVNYPVWKELPDREKIPYLMREIKLVVPDDCALSYS